MEWLNVTAEWGLGGLLLGSFLSATLLPGGSEALLWGFLKLHPDLLGPALALSTVGNTAGGMTSWACGRFLPRWQRLASLPQGKQVERWGSSVLLLAWLPIVGDAFCVAAGWMRLHWLPCCAFMAAGKFLRYWIVAQTAL
ncbi:MAG: DedA family protein [Betaproteobacteria bacterium]|nr:DedA family protein [Betaproteobacteria bacterium]HMV21471.1 DedA family protein [Rhodocyclaceae bacterium]HMW76207.1 DedA family protein [Rhodocyclaceae bacterium]HNE42214.1 DedA family protein [Rhodocyclaceae bacterium]HNM21918.1 DedA family protein [Rhodocyclaceae bacterium]